MEFDPKVLEAVSQLRIRAKRNVATLATGNYRSAFRGSGMQFKEFRHYEPGDDIRHMSWTVTARTGKPTLKTYEEERELNVILMVDISGSSLFGMAKSRKLDMYAELVSVIGLAALESGDKLGALFFSDQPGLFLPPRRSREQLGSLLTQLLSQPQVGNRSDLKPALRFLSQVLKQKSILIVISDFWLPDFEEAFIPVAERNETIFLHCFDDAERGFLPTGVLEAWHPETNKPYLVDASSVSMKRKLAEKHTGLVNELEALAHRTRTDYLCLSKQDDYLKRLISFFRYRGPSRI